MIAALGVIGLGEIIFGSAPLLLLAAAIVTASKFAGIGGGLFSVMLSTLAADFFFIPPIFAFNLNQTTRTLGVKYSAIAFLSYLIFHKRQQHTVQIGTSAIC